MNEIILDCDLMRFPHTGLYHYCLNLGNSLDNVLDHGRERIRFYVPPAEYAAFKKVTNCIVEKRYHRFFRPFLRGCRVWHAPFQSGRILPAANGGVKIVLTIHDLNALHEGKSEDEQKRSIVHTQLLINRSDAIICISEFTKSDVLKYCDVKAKPVYVIHNGVNKTPDAALSTSSYRPSRPFLFGIGFVNLKKNYHVLLPLVLNSEMELVVAGKHDEPNYVMGMLKKAEELGIADKVHLTGPVTEQEKGWYMENCTAFVHPSLAEGFGAPPVEAMLCGKPLFLSDKTSLPEIGGDVAFYFSSFEPDHMLHVFNKGMEKYRLNGLAGRIMERGRRFNWEEKARQYIKVYRSLY